MFLLNVLSLLNVLFENSFKTLLKIQTSIAKDQVALSHITLFKRVSQITKTPAQSLKIKKYIPVQFENWHRHYPRLHIQRETRPAQ